MTIAIADAWNERLHALARQRGLSEEQVVDEALRWYFAALDRGFTPSERAEFDALERAADEDFERLGREHDWPWQP